MNLLSLSGYGVKVRVRNLRSHSELEITDGREFDKTPLSMSFRPRRFPYSSIIIDGHSGYVSLQAFHWLSKHKIPMFVLDFDGTVISSVLPPMPVKADLRTAQILAANDPKKKFTIARALVQAKIARSLQVLDWLGERYDIPRELRVTRLEASKLRTATTVPDLRTVEGRVARRYWETFGKAMPEHLDFRGRMTSSHQNNASDPVNLALNYAYGVLEGECRRAINAVGLEPSVGFLHELSDYQTKQSLVYDLEEPFRWLADISVIEAFESEALKLSDFYFTGDDYRYRFESEARQRFVEILVEKFNSGAVYKSHKMKWDTIIQEKTSELGRYMSCQYRILNFSDPPSVLERADDRAIRKTILGLTRSEARQRGIGRSTLHYLRKNARSDFSFKIYGVVRTKLEGNLTKS